MSNTRTESRTQVAHTGQPTNTADQKQPFVEPKLTFVEPKLTKQGDFVDLTEGFFGPFTPPSS